MSHESEGIPKNEGRHVPNLILKRKGARDQPISFSPNKGSQEVFQKILAGTLNNSEDEFKKPPLISGYRKMKTYQEKDMEKGDRFNGSALDLTSSIDEDISSNGKKKLRAQQKPPNLSLSKTQNEETEEKFDSFSSAVNHALSPTKSSSPKKKKTE